MMLYEFYFFFLIFVIFSQFHFSFLCHFSIKKKLMNIILTHKTKYAPVCFPFDFLMTLSDYWDTPLSNPIYRRSGEFVRPTAYLLIMYN